MCEKTPTKIYTRNLVWISHQIQRSERSVFNVLYQNIMNGISRGSISKL
jgi:hypothetical protein